MAAMAIVAGNAAMSRSPIGQPPDRSRMSLSRMGRSLPHYFNSDDEHSVEMKTQSRELLQSATSGSRSLSSSFNSGDICFSQACSEYDNDVTHKWPLENCKRIQASLSLPLNCNSSYAIQVPVWNTEADDIDDKLTPRDITDDDFDASASAVSITPSPLLNSPPPPLRHHLLFPPLGDSDDHATDNDAGSSVMPGKVDSCGVGCGIARSEDSPKTNSSSQRSTPATDSQENRNVGRLSSQHVELLRVNANCPDRLRLNDNESCSTFDNRPSSSAVRRGGSSGLTRSLEEIRSDYIKAARPTTLVVRSRSESTKFGETNSARAGALSGQNLCESALTITNESLSSLPPPTSTGKLATGDPSDGQHSAMKRLLSLDIDGTRLRSENHAMKDFDDVSHSDMAKTPIVERQGQLGRLAISDISASDNFESNGIRNPAARKLVYEVDRVMVAPSVGGKKDGGFGPKKTHTMMHRRFRRVRGGDGTATAAENFRLFDHQLLQPSSSSYLSDCSSSSSSLSSSEESARISRNKVPEIGRQVSGTAGVRRRRGRRAAELTSLCDNRRAFRLGFERRRKPSQQCDSSTDHQMWDEYQADPYASNGDYHEEKIDPGLLIQADWSLKGQRRYSDDDDSENLHRRSRLRHDIGNQSTAGMAQYSARPMEDNHLIRCHKKDSGDCWRSTFTDSAEVATVGYEWENIDSLIDRHNIRKNTANCNKTVSEPCAISDSDAEDLEQLIEDSRRALYLTMVAFHDEQLLMKTASDTLCCSRDDSGSSSTGSGSATSRRYRQLKLNEEIATCRTNIECLQLLIDAMDDGTKREVGKLSTDVHILTDLLNQWRHLEKDIIFLVASVMSQTMVTAQQTSSTADESLRSGEEPVQSSSNNQANVNIVKMKDSHQLKWQSRRKSQTSGEVAATGSDSGQYLFTASRGCATSCDEELTSMSADAVLVDETKIFVDYQTSSMLHAPSASNFDHVVDLSDCHGIQDDLEALQTSEKRRPSRVNRMYSSLSAAHSYLFESKGSLLKTFLLALLILAVVVYIIGLCYSAPGKFLCRMDSGLSLNPRLRYVLGPPPV